MNGTFAYVGSGAFAGGGNTSAKVVGDLVQFDFDGNGSLDMSIKLIGLTSAAELSASDFLFT